MWFTMCCQPRTKHAAERDTADATVSIQGRDDREDLLVEERRLAEEQRATAAAAMTLLLREKEDLEQLFVDEMNHAAWQLMHSNATAAQLTVEMGQLKLQAAEEKAALDRRLAEKTAAAAKLREEGNRIAGCALLLQGVAVERALAEEQLADRTAEAADLKEDRDRLTNRLNHEKAAADGRLAEKTAEANTLKESTTGRGEGSAPTAREQDSRGRSREGGAGPAHAPTGGGEGGAPATRQGDHRGRTTRSRKERAGTGHGFAAPAAHDDGGAGPAAGGKGGRGGQAEGGERPADGAPPGSRAVGVRGSECCGGGDDKRTDPHRRSKHGADTSTDNQAGEPTRAATGVNPGPRTPARDVPRHPTGLCASDSDSGVDGSAATEGRSGDLSHESRGTRPRRPFVRAVRDRPRHRAHTARAAEVLAFLTDGGGQRPTRLFLVVYLSEPDPVPSIISVGLAPRPAIPSTDEILYQSHVPPHCTIHTDRGIAHPGITHGYCPSHRI